MSEEHHADLEGDVESLVAWYLKNRQALVDDTYLTKGSTFRQIVKPFQNWDSAVTLRKEVAFNVRALAALHGLESAQPRVRPEAWTLVILALKNRLEFASNQADFFPVYITFATVSASALFATQSKSIQIVLGLAMAAFVTLLVLHRIEGRQRVARLRELINILEVHAKSLAVPNPSIERTPSSVLRTLPVAAHVQR